MPRSFAAAAGEQEGAPEFPVHLRALGMERERGPETALRRGVIALSLGLQAGPVGAEEEPGATLEHGLDVPGGNALGPRPEGLVETGSGGQPRIVSFQPGDPLGCSGSGQQHPQSRFGVVQAGSPFQGLQEGDRGTLSVTGGGQQAPQHQTGGPVLGSPGHPLPGRRQCSIQAARHLQTVGQPEPAARILRIEPDGLIEGVDRPPGIIQVEQGDTADELGRRQAGLLGERPLGQVEGHHVIGPAAGSSGIQPGERSARHQQTRPVEPLGRPQGERRWGRGVPPAAATLDPQGNGQPAPEVMLQLREPFGRRFCLHQFPDLGRLDIQDPEPHPDGPPR